MIRSRRGLIAFAAACSLLFFAIQPAQAKSDKGYGKGHGKDKSGSVSAHSGQGAESTPPGWSRGKKTGWGDGKYPPGWSKWKEGRKAKWRGDRIAALDEIDSVCQRYRIREDRRSQIRQGFDEAIAGGLIIDDARKKLVSGLADSKQRKEFMVDTAQSVLEFLK
ncbi:MAG: hypothetical protein JXA24_01070 [Proteobacteria bacterium]|nr:hypothetical protein [Pseudomonadota bacterium]